MDVNVQITGLEEAIEKIERLHKIASSDELKKYIAEKAINEINKVAKQRLSQSNNYVESNEYELINEGILIYNNVQNDKGEYYSLILEYGSGTYAEGESFHHTASYENSGGLYWLVPVEEASSLMNTDFGIITLDSGDYFKVYGQQSKHIYTDAFKEIQKKLSKWADEFIAKEMK